SPDVPIPETHLGRSDCVTETSLLFLEVFDNAIDFNQANRFRYQDRGLVGDFEIIVGPGVQSFHDRFSVFLNSADEENRCGEEGLVGAYHVAKLNATYLGHRDVTYHQIWP